MLLLLSLLALAEPPAQPLDGTRSRVPDRQTLMLGDDDGLATHYRLWSELPESGARPLSVAHEIALSEDDVTRIVEEKPTRSWTPGDEATELEIPRADIVVAVEADGTWSAGLNGRPGGYSLGTVGPARQILVRGTAIAVITDAGFWVFSEEVSTYDWSGKTYKGLAVHADTDGLLGAPDQVRYTLYEDRVGRSVLKLVALPWDAEADAPTGERGYAFAWPRTGLDETTLIAAALRTDLPPAEWPSGKTRGSVFLHSPPPALPRYRRPEWRGGVLAGLDLGLLPDRSRRGIGALVGVRGRTSGRRGHVELELGSWRQELALAARLAEPVSFGIRGGLGSGDPYVLADLEVRATPGVSQLTWRVGVGSGLAADFEVLTRIARVRSTDVRVGLQLRSLDQDVWRDLKVGAPVVAGLLFELRESSWRVRVQ